MVVSLRVESVPGQGMPSMKTVDVNIPPLDLQGKSLLHVWECKAGATWWSPRG